MTEKTRAQQTRAAETRVAEQRPALITDDDDDPFKLPPGVVPPEGMRYEWKRVAVRGQADDANVAELQRKGWMPVPYDRHPELGGNTWAGYKAPKWVMRKGTHMLCERPEHVCQQVEQSIRRKTHEQTAAKKAELGLGSHPDIPRSGYFGDRPELTETVESPTGAVLGTRTTQIERGLKGSDTPEPIDR